MLRDEESLAFEKTLKAAQDLGGSWLDPHILPLIGRPVKEVYGKILSEQGMSSEELWCASA